jgi:hypothetical protein
VLPRGYEALRRRCLSVSRIVDDLGAIPRASRNHTWLTFTDPARREIFTDWEHRSGGALA